LKEDGVGDAPQIVDVYPPEDRRDGTRVYVKVSPVEGATDYRVYVSAYPNGSGAMSLGRSADAPNVLYLRGLQVAAFSLFTGRDRQARDVLAAVPQRRIATQIEPDGRQPRELSRTRALTYSTMNLGLLFDLATVAGRSGIDLWHYRTDDGRGIQDALDWLLPFWIQAKPWPYQQITPFSRARTRELLCRAYRAYGNPTYAGAASKAEEAPDSLSDHRSRLCWPVRAPTDPSRNPEEVTS
jgi:hypothetical protein